MTSCCGVDAGCWIWHFEIPPNNSNSPIKSWIKLWGDARWLPTVAYGTWIVSIDGLLWCWEIRKIHTHTWGPLFCRNRATLFDWLHRRRGQKPDPQRVKHGKCSRVSPKHFWRDTSPKSRSCSDRTLRLFQDSLANSILPVLSKHRFSNIPAAPLVHGEYQPDCSDCDTKACWNRGEEHRISNCSYRPRQESSAVRTREI